MERPRQHMDITKPVRPVGRRFRWRPRHSWVAAGTVVVLALALLAGHWYFYRNQQTINHSEYQIVYLVTGQIYFGKLQNTDGSYLTLDHVFTVQNQTSNGTAEQVTDAKLLQVSQQVYGPEDTMAIRADQVQFWQNLRSDSKVTKAIESNQ